MMLVSESQELTLGADAYHEVLTKAKLVHEPQTPPAVVIDEAIEIAKRFGGEESGQFVNGVLDAVRKTLPARRS